MNFKCDKCGHEFQSDDLPDEDQPCPGCGDTDCTFSIVE